MIFFMGISPEMTERNTVVVVVKRYLKNIKKHYEPVKIIPIPLSMADPSLGHEIARLYQDNQFILNKKIFSQDRRPTKMVRAHPKLILNRNRGGSSVKSLRASGIPVDGILPVEGNDPWIKHPHGKALGDDYDVPLKDLFETLMEVHEQKRLVLTGDFRAMVIQIEKLKETFTKNKENPEIFPKDFEASDVLTALALPLWFNEKIPYQRAYKA
ncbi:MAG: hypothetical protein KKF30_11340 [Proteobacteria bacterium]|nr:hypothetical protein [Pseudomonadota bacterium]MBU4471211.1 hypothetical protein [Pseudomonadota bacterium]MCG2753186.1 hypothetical protein [Desulfobacteraceae bacterium]